MTRVFVDQVMCTGAGVCVSIAPGIFVLDEGGLATVIADGSPLPDGGAPGGVAVEGEGLALARDAQAACPGGCIDVLED